jgi:hypothetical protein
MIDTKDVIALVIDTGVFQHVARRLGRDYKKVYYWSPWELAFPRLKDAIVCDGYPEVTRVESIESVKKECDLFVFTDIGYSDLQMELVEMGKAVWGCRNADELEARRGKFLEVLSEKTNLPVPEFNKIKGLTNLRLFLKDAEDVYIKVSTYRGDFETCHFRNMEVDEGLLDKWGIILGPLREHMNFFVFSAIDTDIEDGVDTYCIDGQFPETVIHGMECKDSAYIGGFQRMKDVPEEVRCVNEDFSPVLAAYGYRSAFSTEVRITKGGESFFIDPTCRFPSPPSQVMCEMVGNLGEIMWRGANGILVEPEQVAKFGAQAIFNVHRDEWSVYEIPEELDQWVKIAFSCKVDGKICVPPDSEGISEIGWVVGIGDTIQDAITHLRENKDAMPGGCDVKFDSLAKLLKEIHSAQEKGMEFTDEEVPEPSSIIDEE